MRFSVLNALTPLVLSEVSMRLCMRYNLCDVRLATMSTTSGLELLMRFNLNTDDKPSTLKHRIQTPIENVDVNNIHTDLIELVDNEIQPYLI